MQDQAGEIRMAQALGTLIAAYPKQNIPQASIRVYGEALSDLEPTEVERAALRIMRRSEWFPAIAEIRREVAEERCALPSVEEAWEMAREYSRQPGLLASVEPLVYAAMQDVGGGYEIRVGQTRSVAQAFRRSYEARREHAIRDAIGANHRPAGERLALPEPRPQLPPSERIRPRPVVARSVKRLTGQSLEPPTEEEKRDAIDMLRLGFEGEPDMAYLEAERILHEASQAVE